MTDSPFAPLGLPATFNPAVPRTFKLGCVTAMTPQGPARLHVIAVSTADGILGLPLDDAGARDLIDKLRAQLAGIEIVGALPDGNGKAAH